MIVSLLFLCGVAASAPVFATLWHEERARRIQGESALKEKVRKILDRL